MYSKPGPQPKVAWWRFLGFLEVPVGSFGFDCVNLREPSGTSWNPSEPQFRSVNVTVTIITIAIGCPFKRVGA